MRECVRAALAQTVTAHVIVVDDHSPDDTADRVAAEFPGVTLIRNPRNLGFARACNVGLDAGTARSSCWSTATSSSSRMPWSECSPPCPPIATDAGSAAGRPSSWPPTAPSTPTASSRMSPAPDSCASTAPR